MKEHRAPFPPRLLQGKHFTCPPGFITRDGSRASSTSALPGTAQQAPSRHRFGLIRPVLIQLQKFGKHSVNSPRPAEGCFDAVPERGIPGSSQRVTSPAPAALPNAGISGRFAAEAKPPRPAAEGEEGEAGHREASEGLLQGYKKHLWFGEEVSKRGASSLSVTGSTANLARAGSGASPGRLPGGR